MKFSFVFSVMIGILAVGCSSSEIKTTNETPTETTDSTTLPELSIYNLPSSWTTQDGKDIELKELRGKVLVVVMIYTSCQASCPRLVADVRHVKEAVPEAKNKNVQYVFVSIDPEVDTPERLKEFAKENQMDSDQWLFLRGSEEDTREFAAVLAVSYKEISPIDFSHSNIISVFDKDGVLVNQKEGLGTDDSETIKAIEQYAG